MAVKYLNLISLPTKIREYNVHYSSTIQKGLKHAKLEEVRRLWPENNAARRKRWSSARSEENIPSTADIVTILCRTLALMNTPIPVLQTYSRGFLSCRNVHLYHSESSHHNGHTTHTHTHTPAFVVGWTTHSPWRIQ
jgi:hypothetical protein